MIITQKVSDITSTKLFRGVPLTDGKPGINIGQFMTAVIDELSRRVNVRSALLSDLQSLYMNNWPSDCDELILFGEQSVIRLTKRLGLPTRPVIEAFRRYKSQKGKPSPELLQLPKHTQEAQQNVKGDFLP